MGPLSNNYNASALILGGGRGDTSTDSSMAYRGGGDYHFMELHGQPSLSDDEIVTINVSGMRFQTLDSTLKRFPDSILGSSYKRRRFWNAKTNEYFIDRHRLSFESVLHIYQSDGHVIRPESVPINVFLRELKYYEFDSTVMSNFWESEGYQKPKEEVMPTGRLQCKVWELMEHPDSSIAARILAFMSIFVIVVKSTIQRIATERILGEWSSPFFFIEFVCCIWFSAEFLVRFGSSPNKCIFLKSPLNILDVVAVVPFFVNLIWDSLTPPSNDKSSSAISLSVLRIIRLVRVFRIFKLSRHSVGLQVLGKTFRASVQEFALLVFFLCIALVLFSSCIYFTESGEPNSEFTSIPASMWFVLATITTVGFGDLVPTSTPGKIVGSCCALIGVLTLALPVPIIVAQFKHFYRQECRLAALYTQNMQEAEVEEQTRLDASPAHNGSLKPNGIQRPNVAVTVPSEDTD